MWRPLIVAIILLAIVGVVFGFKLGSSTNGVSTPEQQYVHSVVSGQGIVNNPSFAIHKVPVYALFKLHVSNIAAYRAVSTVFAVSAVIASFFILRRWYSNRVAGLGSALLLTSAWTLHVGRLATPESTFLLVLPLLAIFLWLIDTDSRWAFTIFLLVAGLSLYLPGFVWLIVFFAIWQRKIIRAHYKKSKIFNKILGGLAVVVALVSIIYASFQSVNILLVTVGLPTSIPSASTLLNNAINIPRYLFWQGPNDPVRWLGRIPLLDVFSVVMLGLGTYRLRFYKHKNRALLTVGMASVMAVLIILGGAVTVTALMPIVYLLIAGGLAFMLQQWMTVFPRNPIARMTGFALMSAVVLLVVYYHTSMYFVAWARAPETRHVFTSANLLK